jgi:hypothetical protein
MFLWTFIAHMVLPLGESGVQQIANEEPLLAHLSTALPAPGLYMFPGMPPNGDQATYYRKIASGPSGLMVYFPKREFVFGTTLGVEFATELAQCLIGVWLLTLTGLRTFVGRLGFFAGLGVLSALATNVSYWNWYGFPASYTLAYMLTTWAGFACAGVVAAFMKVGQSSEPSGKRLPA